MDSLTILFISANFSPVPCGVGDYTAHLASELGRKGHAVTVLTSRPDLPTPSNVPFILKRLIPQWDIRGAWCLWRFLHHSDAAVVSFQYVPHAFGHRGINLSTPLALLAARIFLGKSIVVTGHELYVEWGANPLHWPLSLIHYLQLVILLLAANRLMVVTEEQTLRLQPFLKWIPRPVEWIPVGANTLPVEPLLSRKQAKEQLGIQNEFIIGSFWLKEPRGALAKLQRWVGQLRERGMDTFLLIIGKGEVTLPEPAWIRQTRYLETHAEISQHLSCLDLFISARGEGPTTRNTSITAALAHGLPTVVLHRQDRAPDPFWKNSGVVVIDGDVNKIADALRTLLLDPAQRALLSQQARRFYEQHFAWAAIASAVETVFRNAVTGGDALRCKD